MYIGESDINLTGEEAFEVFGAMRGMEMHDEARLVANAINGVIQLHRPGVTITDQSHETYDRYAKAEFLQNTARLHVVPLPLSVDLVNICSELLHQEGAFVQMRHKAKPKSQAPPPRPPAGYRPGNHQGHQGRPVG